MEKTIRALVGMQAAKKALGAKRAGLGLWSYPLADGSEGECTTAELISLGKDLTNGGDEACPVVADWKLRTNGR